MSKLFKSKYYKELRIDYRELLEDGHRLLEGVLVEFFREFHIQESLYDRIVSSGFTVIGRVGGSLSLEEAEE